MIDLEIQFKNIATLERIITGAPQMSRSLRHFAILTKTVPNPLLDKFGLYWAEKAFFPRESVEKSQQESRWCL
jgi:hypothetical protein